MRIDTVSIPQSFVESPKPLDKKELTRNESKNEPSSEEAQSFIPAPFGLSKTYSLSSLKAAVGYHAKFLTVAQNNLEAVKHPPAIPRAILDSLVASACL
jgi:hypothetical protein